MPAGRDITSNNASNQKINLKAGQTISPANLAIFQDIASLRTYLLTQGYTDAQLDKMLKNDLIYAARKKLAVGV